MSKSNARKFAVLILLISICVGLCACSFPQPKPKEGIWHCPELGITLDFFVFNQQQTEYFAKKDNTDGTVQDIMCLFDYGSLIVLCSLDQREKYLTGHFLYQEENQFREESFTVTTIDGDHTYIFERIDN